MSPHGPSTAPAVARSGEGSVAMQAKAYPVCTAASRRVLKCISGSFGGTRARPPQATRHLQLPVELRAVRADLCMGTAPSIVTQTNSSAKACVKDALPRPPRAGSLRVRQIPKERFLCARQP